MNVLTQFVRSKNGLVLLACLAFCAAVSAGAAYQFYKSGLETFRAFAIDVPMAPFLECDLNRSMQHKRQNVVLGFQSPASCAAVH